ncbi:MAG TPA: hypothetical protein VH333_00075, partial [Pseudonocardiaceae bacterium]|nr:hypothetical protein [Pseudonocardiaceae bacterium]
MSTEESLRQQLDQAQDLPYGDTKDVLLEDVLRHAEAAELTRLAFDVRMQQINAYAMGMTRAKVFVPFARCLADYDRNPAEYGQRVAHTLLWSFKYAIGSMTKFPEISLDQVHGALEDMAGRYERGGHSPHAVYKYRYHVASHVGDQDAADHWYERWCAAPRDQLSDCVACEPTSMVDYLSSRGRDAEAIAIAEPVLGQQLTCEAQPQAILSTLLWPYARTGRAAEARAAHRRAYRLLRTRPQDLDDLADHVLFCACTGNEARGMELLERHIGWLDRASSPFHGMRFAATCALLLRRVTESGLGTMRILRPGHADRPTEEMAVAALGAELTTYAFAQAARFDQRNGSTHQTERMRTLIDAAPVAEHIPLSVVTPGRPVPERAPEPTWTGLSTAEIVEKAEQSLSHGDEAAAHAALRELADRTDDDPVLLGRIAALRGRSDLTGGEADFRQAAELFAAGGDESRRQSVLGRLGALLSQRDGAEDGMPLQRAALAYFQQTGDAESEVWTSLRLAGSLVILSDVDEAAKLLDRATELAAGLDDDLMPGALAWARVDLCGSDADAAIVATDEALRLFQRTGLARMIA